MPLSHFQDAFELLENRFQDDKQLWPQNALGPSSQDGPSPCLSLREALEYLLDAAIERFGYAARDVYSGIFGFQQHINRHRILYTSPVQLQEVVSALSGELPCAGNSQISDRIVTLSTVYRGGYIGNVDWKIDFKSAWVAKQFTDTLADDDEVRRQISFFRKREAANGVVRYLFEPFVHRMLANPAKKGRWPLKAMSYEDTDQPTAKIAGPAPADVRFSKIKRPIRRFHDFPSRLVSGVYYWSYATYYPFFDAFTVEIKDNAAVLWILQITTSHEQGDSGAGYWNVRDIINRLKTQMHDETPRAKARKTVSRGDASAPSVEVRYLLVVPKGGDEGLEWTYPKGWKDCCQRNDHRGKVYCLELPLTVSSAANPEERFVTCLIIERNGLSTR